MINETDAGPKDAVAAIRKRLTGSSKNFHIINLTLTVSGDNQDADTHTSVGCTRVVIIMYMSMHICVQWGLVCVNNGGYGGYHCDLI